MRPDARRSLPIQGPFDLRGTNLKLTRSDPTLEKGRTHFAKATRTPAGPATWAVHLASADQLDFLAWGPGAEWCAERAEGLSGLWDQGWDWDPGHPVVRELQRRRPGMRMPRHQNPFETLVPIVLGQLVQDVEKVRAMRLMTRALSEPAPGPVDLLLPVAPRALARVSTARLRSFGVLGFQARTLHELAFCASRLLPAAELPEQEARELLLSVPGIGEWSVGMAGIQGLGHADAVPWGDYNLPALLAHRLAGIDPASEVTRAQQEQWLAPWTGNRARLLKLLWATGGGPKRRNAKAALRPIDE